jgi:hypothetical protein
LDDDLNPDGSTLESKDFWVGNAISGNYKVDVFGTGTGKYRLEFLGSDENGGTSRKIIVGQTSPGIVDSFYVTYSTKDGIKISDYHLYLPLIFH